jgi:hypothetical protein
LSPTCHQTGVAVLKVRLYALIEMIIKLALKYWYLSNWRSDIWLLVSKKVLIFFDALSRIQISAIEI